MKKITLALVLLFTSGVLFAESYPKGTIVYISAKTTNLRNNASPLSSVITEVEYGDSGVVIESNQKSTKIKLSGTEEIGWISNGSLTKKKILASSKGTRTTSDELAMAGKGFSAEAESAFKQANEDLPYDLVDAIEEIEVSDEELLAFLKDGKLKRGEQ